MSRNSKGYFNGEQGMAKLGKLQKILIWSHERGSLPYDIICALILAFIFLVPRGCLISEEIAAHDPTYQSADVDAVDEMEP